MKRIGLLILTLFMAAIIYASCDVSLNTKRMDVLKKAIERTSSQSND